MNSAQTAQPDEYIESVLQLEDLTEVAVNASLHS